MSARQALRHERPTRGCERASLRKRRSPLVRTTCASAGVAHADHRNRRRKQACRIAPRVLLPLVQGERGGTAQLARSLLHEWRRGLLGARWRRPIADRVCDRQAAPCSTWPDLAWFVYGRTRPENPQRCAHGPRPDACSRSGACPGKGILGRARDAAVRGSGGDEMTGDGARAATSAGRIPEATDHDIAWLVLCDQGYSSSLAAASLQLIGPRGRRLG
jgi:hypothetical protein